MAGIESLVDQINEFHKKHDRWPEVSVSWAFFDKYPDQVSKLHSDGIDVTVSESLQQEESFVLRFPNDVHPTISTLSDLKNEVDKLVAEGKGDWPVKFLPHDARAYLRIKLCPILPGNAPSEGLEIAHSYADAPEGEHILVLVGGDQTEEDNS